MIKTDYRKLCAELFGTDDPDELRRIAEGLSRKNPRNAGRKRRFTEQDVSRMRELRAQGIGMQPIADAFGTSRQVISRYLAEASGNSGRMKLTYMFRRDPCTVIYADFRKKEISIKNRTEDPLHRAFGIVEKPDWKDFSRFLSERCFPEERGDRDEILKVLGLREYDPLQIIQITEGRQADDDLWLKIQCV